MRVQCPNCKKKFDYDKEEGFCPHCATLLTVRPETGKTKALKTESVRTKPAKPNSAKAVSAQAKSAEAVSVGAEKPRKRIRIPLIGWVIIVIIGAYAGSTLVANLYGKHLAKEQRAGYLEPWEFELGETIVIDGEEITITEIDWNPEPAVEVPDKEQLLRIQYVTNEDYGAEVEALLCVDGAYAVSQLNLGMKVDDATVSHNYTTHPQAGESNLGFVIPKDAKSVQLVLTDAAVQERYVLEVK